MATKTLPSWLNPLAAPFLSQPDDKRVAFIRSEHYVKHDGAVAALNALEFIYTQPRRRRMDCLFIGGDSGAGKTKTAQLFIRSKGLEFEENEWRVRSTEEGVIPIVTIDLSGLLSIDDLFHRLADGCISPTDARFRTTSDTAMRLLTRTGAVMLVLDEAQEITKLSGRDQERCLGVIKYVSNELRMAVVALGARALKHVFAADEHLRNRFTHDIMLDQFEYSEGLRGFVASLVSLMPLHKPPQSDNQEFLSRVLHASEGRAKRITNLIQASATHAVRCKHESLDLSMLQKAIEYPFKC